MLLVALASAMAQPVLAAEVANTAAETPERDWSVDFTPYLWVVNVNGELAGGPINNNFGVGIVSILEHLQGMAMADLTLRYKRVGVIADGMWASLSAADTQPVGNRTVSVATDLSTAWGTGAAFFRFRPMPGLTLDPYVGARWWRIHTTVNISDIGPVLPPRSQYLDGVVTWADPIFGLKVNYDVTRKWRVKAAADVGGGVSDVSWQALVGGAYEFTPWFGVDVVYRVMGVDYQPNQSKLELIFNGILFGFNFHY